MPNLPRYPLWVTAPARILLIPRSSSGDPQGLLGDALTRGGHDHGPPGDVPTDVVKDVYHPFWWLKDEHLVLDATGESLRSHRCFLLYDLVIAGDSVYDDGEVYYRYLLPEYNVAAGQRLLTWDWRLPPALEELGLRFGEDWHSEYLDVVDPVVGHGLPPRVPLRNPPRTYPGAPTEGMLLVRWTMGMHPGEGCRRLASLASGEAAAVEANDGRTLVLGFTPGALHGEHGAGLAVNLVDYALAGPGVFRKFGHVDLGRQVPKRFLVRNVSDAPVTVERVALTGPDAGDYRLAHDGVSGNTLAPGGGGELEITFCPASFGLRSAEVSIPYGGEATAFELQGFGLPSARAHIETATLRFKGLSGHPAVGLWNSGAVIVHNLGRSLRLDPPRVDGEHAAVFQANCEKAGQPIHRDESVAVSVKFQPGGAGRRRAWLRIPTSDPDLPVASVELVGEAIGEEDGWWCFGLGWRELDFGATHVGEGVERWCGMFLMNAKATVQIGQLEITGPDAAEFRLVNDECSQRLLIGGAGLGSAGSFVIRFAPVRPGPKEACLVALSDGNPRRGELRLIASAHSPPAMRA